MNRFARLSLSLAVVAPCAIAQATDVPPLAVPHYRVTSLPTLGGTIGQGNSIDDLGLIAGFAGLAGDASWHATAWLFGFTADLGTLGGPNSNVPWPVQNNVGLVAGIAQTAVPEPLGARWSCRSFFPTPSNVGYTCLGFAWEGGRMRALPTLGGNNGFATGANDRRQIAGWAENDVHDSTCLAPYQYLQFRPVVWGPGRDAVRALPVLQQAGDTSGAATALNNRGQVVGISGTCDRAVGRFSAAHAVLWEGGRVTDIGSLGGVAWNTPMAINERGDVVGFSNVSATDGGAFHAHAFAWTRRDGMRDLGTLPGDTHSQALGMNNLGQAVGQSCNADFSVCRAVLWQGGTITDLNTRIAGAYDGQLLFAQDINDFGVVTGEAYISADGTTPAFRATPSFLAQRAPATATGVPTRLSPAARAALLQRFGIEELDLAH
jgi:probable HAF family extracellular repeat protein